MAALKILGGIVGFVLGGALLLAGCFGLASAYAADSPQVGAAFDALQGAVTALNNAGLNLPIDSVVKAEQILAAPLARFSLAPVGLVLMIASVLWGRGFGGGVPKQPKSRSGAKKKSGRAETKAEKSQAEPERKLTKFEKKALKKTQKSAGVLARKGKVQEAAELLFEAGDYATAADYFIDAKQYERAAEIRHDQNRFLESAELYVKAGKFDSAGTIFSQQEEWLQAAECYLEIDRTSVAAEMFEKAEEHLRAAGCYRDSGFLRHAAQAFVKCKHWQHAADCLAQVYSDEGSKGHLDPKKAAELRKLIRQAGQLYRKAGKLDEAQSVLERGGCPLEAGELALEREQYAKASELFIDAGESRRAAQALRTLGEDGEAARILALYHRDQGEVKEAAVFFEEAGDHLAAGDHYRQLEDYSKAGECYRRQAEFAQAAEMFNTAGDRQAAAECFEEAGRFSEAAECFALVGKADREAELLSKAGEFRRAGEAYRREGMDDEAIKVLQQVPPEGEDFSAASALLGEIFHAHGQLGLAVKKLEQAIGDEELSRENLDVYYTLARVHDADEQARAAVDIYEKIMTFDYHYKDVEERLQAARDVVESLPGEADAPADAAGGGARSGSVPSQSGRYQVVGELGRGGMGIVYKANDTVLDRVVAYKVLPDGLNENPQALQNFLREAKAAAKLNHPNIVTVYDCGEQDGRYFIAMEHVDGTTLKEIIRRRGVISAAGIVHVAMQLCEALAYAHESKVVHRDIKTANAMWTRDKKVKIMDFGLAKLLEEVRNNTTVVAGTPYYMSPEQTLGRNVDHRSDIYSLGVTIFEMATGSVPFKEGNIPYHHVHTPPPDVRDRQAGIPDELARIVTRCLIKDPAQRYQSAREIIEELRAIRITPTS